MSEASFSPFIKLIFICLATIPPLLTNSTELDWERRVNVSQSDGIDKPACLNGSVPCRTLDFALQNVTNSTLVQVYHSKYPYNLTQNVTLRNVHRFGFVGDGLISVKCENRGSLSFENCVNITITGIKLEGCGSLHASTVHAAETFEHSHIQFLSAIFFVYCKNIAIDNCWIVNSPGIGLNMYDIGGDVRISNCWFSVDDRPDENSNVNDIAIVGGGIYMELTKQGGMPPFDTNSSTLAAFDSNSRYTFHNCTFKGNVAPDANVTHEQTKEKIHDPFGQGGGLSIILRGKAENNSIRISYCHFENNTAQWGGGAFTEFANEVQNITLEVVNCYFRNNTAKFAGGGFRIRTAANGFHEGDRPLASKMKYENCIFESNLAPLGGGFSYYKSDRPLMSENDNNLNIEFKNCNWHQNAATLGSAISIYTFPFINGLQSKTGERSSYSILLDDCNITNNSIVLTEDKVIGQGAIFSYSFPIIFNGSVIIESNNNTAMVIENVVLHVCGNVTFKNNSGRQGGALGLYGTSVIMLMPDSLLIFLNNTVSDVGGALFAANSGPPVLAFNNTKLEMRTCFIAYNNSLDPQRLDEVSKWRTKIIFKGNKVLNSTSGGGESVYVATLEGCRQSGQRRINNESLNWPIIQYNDSGKTLESQISTDPVLIDFNESEWEVYPSEVFDASIKLVDEKNSSALAVVKITITSINDDHHNAGDRVSLGTVSDLFLVQALGNASKITNLTLKGRVNSLFKVQISTLDGRVQSGAKHMFKLKPCRPGFEQTDNQTCSCIQTKHERGISHCSNKHVYLKKGYWAGMVGSKFSTYPCPRDYCSNITENSTFQYSREQMCTKGRDGSSTLCGECKKNLSLNLGNEECSKTCSSKYLALALVGFCIITLLIVLIVFRINLDIFTAYLNTWLYSYQIILFLLEEGQSLDKVISFIIALANWRIKGVGICIYPGLNNLEKLAINYVCPVYVLVLLFVLAKIARCRPGCFINRNAARAVCTLLVLCYTNVTMISFNIVYYVSLKGKLVLYADGNIEFMTDWKKHLPFTIIAALWIVFFVVLIPLLLLFTPWFLRLVPKLNKFRLFFDTFQKCFKVQYRWFAGYYFICRLWMLMIILFVPIWPLRRSILEVSCVIIAAICLYLQPYNEQYHWFNRLDAVLLTNLCLVVSFSSSFRSDVTQSLQNVIVSKLVNVLAYIPLVYLIFLVCYQGWKYCCSKNWVDHYAPVEEDDLPSTSETGALSCSL